MLPDKLCIGIDLGGTKTEIIVMSTQGEQLLRRRVPTVCDDYTATLRTIQTLVLDAETQLQCQVKATVGVATPGAVSSASGFMKNANSTWLNGRPLQADLENMLQRDVRLANDANCFTLSEAIDGAGSQAAVVFGVIVGTGTGGGISVRRHILRGANAIAGEWGHNPLPWPQADELPGPDCYCGKRGCIETFLSGPALVQAHYRRTGQRFTTHDIVRRAQQGDSACELTLQRYEAQMAKALAHVINLLDPDVIVLGGGMSNVQRLYSNVPRLWADYVFSDAVNTPLLAAMHGDSSGVRGAAWLWRD